MGIRGRLLRRLFLIVLRNRESGQRVGRRCHVDSKGHAALIQYAALCELGYFPREELKRVKSLGGLLQGHLDLSIPGIEAVTGSLGQGLSIGLGMALAFRLDRVDNLTAFIDWNKIQATGPTKNQFDIPNLDAKWAAFGWEVMTVNGHDVEAIMGAIERAKTVKGRPTLIILDTIKGKCFSFAENNAAYHNGILDDAKYAQACRELEDLEKGL